MKYPRLMTFLLFMMSSCMSTRSLTSDVKPNEVTDLQGFETFSYISLIESGNKAKYNDTLSEISKDLMTKVLASFKDSIPITGKITVAGGSLKRKLNREIESLCVWIDRNRTISNLKITPAIDSLLESREKRFGLITASAGFTRVKGNFGGQMAKGVVTGIMTLGMYYETPVKSSSTVYAIIVDSKENNIAFFKKSILQDKEPLDEDVLKKQIQKIFRGYFWRK